MNRPALTFVCAHWQFPVVVEESVAFPVHAYRKEEVHTYIPILLLEDRRVGLD